MSSHLFISIKYEVNIFMEIMEKFRSLFKWVCFGVWIILSPPLSQARLTVSVYLLSINNFLIISKTSIASRCFIQLISCHQQLLNLKLNFINIRTELKRTVIEIIAKTRHFFNSYKVLLNYRFSCKQARFFKVLQSA